MMARRGGGWRGVQCAGRIGGGVLLVGLLAGGCGSGDDGGGGSDPGPFPGTVTEFALDAEGCLDTELELDGPAPACRLVEALAPESSLTCLSLGRLPLDGPDDAALVAELRTRLETRTLCGGGAPSCGDFAFCEIVPLAGDPDEIAACAADPATTTPLYCACLNVAEELNGPAGYCYLDPAAAIGNPDASACSGPALRFIDSPAVPLPAPSSPRLWQVCAG
jgi:hypothetical protein